MTIRIIQVGIQGATGSTDHTALTNIGTNTHPQIDTHLASTANPHSVTKAQVGLTNVTDTKVNFAATAAPVGSDDSTQGYTVGSMWIDLTNDQSYICVDSTATTAVWNKVLDDTTVTDHTLLSNIGTKTHAQIDNHIVDGTIHYVQSAISITESQISDLQSYSLTTHNHTLDSLSNATITANSNGELLVWNGTAWVNNTLAEANVSAVGHVHATTDITSGTFADARIAQSNVTQHVAAIDHDLLLNFTQTEHFTEASIDHTAIANIGTNSHTVIDSHLANVTNPHSVTKSQILSGNLIVDADVNATANIQLSKLQVPVIGSPTYNTLGEYLNINGSPGLMTGGALSEGASLTLDVAASSIQIRATDSDTAEILAVDIAASTGMALTLNSNNYIYVEYNAGTPQLVITATKRSDHNTNVFVGQVYKNTTELHINGYNGSHIGNLPHHLVDRLIETEPMARQSGGVISEIGTRNIALTAGKWWEGLHPFSTTAFDSSVAGTFTYWYSDGASSFIKVVTQTTIDNLQYDNGSGSLATLGNNKYGAHWVYMTTDSKVDIMYGEGTYTLADAQDAQPPASLPSHFNSHSRLVGKIIIQKSAATFVSAESTFDLQFSGSLATDHGGLVGLADDDHTQYLLADGTRTLAGNLAVTGTVDGRDVALDGTNQDTHIADGTIHYTKSNIALNDLGDVTTKPWAGRYWRVYVDVNQGSSSTEIKQINLFRPTSWGAGNTIGPYDPTHGTATAISGTASRAFDNPDSQTWIMASNSGWITFDFGTSTEIITLRILSGSNPTDALKDFRLQTSDDNTNWTTVLTVTNEAVWGQQELRTWNLINDVPVADDHLIHDGSNWIAAQGDHTTFSNIGTNTHAQVDTHIADGTLHFTEASIDHTAILNIGTNSHGAIDTHIADGTIHFTKAAIALNELGDVKSPMTLTDGDQLTWNNTNSEWENTAGVATDHNALLNIGTNTHAQIDTHIADGTIHFTQAAISITESQISDLQSYSLSTTATVQTTDATETTLKTLAVVNNDVNTFTIHVSGFESLTGDTHAQVIRGAIKNAGGTSSLVSGSNEISLFADTGAASWVVSVTANDTNDTLDVKVTGEAGKTIDWSMRIDYI